MSLFGKKLTDVKTNLHNAIQQSYGHDPTIWQTGEQVPGVIERVHLTGMDRADGPGEDSWCVEADIVFHFTDHAGAERYVERMVYPKFAPRPGSIVTVAYHPADIQGSIDYDFRHVQRPDPAVPRGWSGGTFGPPAIDRFPPMPANPEFAAERELFRTGVCIEAEVVETKWSAWKQRGEGVMATQTYRANGVDYQKEFWGNPDVSPDRGERIKIVVGSDGMVAIDTDEAFTSPRGRALVFTTPASIAEVQDNPTGNAAQLAALEMMHAKGKLTDAQFEMMKTRMGG